MVVSVVMPMAKRLAPLILITLGKRGTYGQVYLGFAKMYLELLELLLELLLQLLLELLLLLLLS